MKCKGRNSSNEPPCKGSGWLQLFFPVRRADITGFVLLKASTLFTHQQCPAPQSGVIAEQLLFLAAAYGRVGSCKRRELSFLAHCAANCRIGLRITEIQFPDKPGVAVLMSASPLPVWLCSPALTKKHQLAKTKTLR